MSRFALLFPLVPWTLWALAVVLMGGRGPDAVRMVVALSAGALVGAATWRFGLRGLFGGLVLFDLVATVGFAWLRPSHDRSWAEDQSRLPHLTLAGDRLIVENLRTFRYRSSENWTPRWETRTYDLTALEGVDFAVERFTDIEAVGHTLVSFRFADSEPLAVSIEIRKEVGESFSAVKGLFRQYELMYVFGDERDLVELRAVHRQDTVYLHPMAATPALSRAFLEHIVAGAQAVEAEPAFYNTLWASCTTRLADHLRAVHDVSWSWRMHLPGYSDALAFELGMIATDTDFERTRARNRIDARARDAAGSADFSTQIWQPSE